MGTLLFSLVALHSNTAALQLSVATKRSALVILAHDAGCHALQVYELLDVLEASGPDGVAQHAVPHLSWEEMQALTGPGTVGLPLGYKPDAQQKLLGKPAMPAALRAGPAAGLFDAVGEPARRLLQGVESAAVDEAGVAAGDGQCSSTLGGLQDTACEVVVAEEVHELICSHSSVDGSRLGWRQRGWKRTDYLVADGTA
jgi:hypothetical protein